MRRLLTPSLILLLGGASWSQSHQFQITLEHFAGDPSSLDIEVRLFTAGTDVEWPDSVHHITSNPGDITVSALEPGFYDVSIRADRFLRKKLSAVPFGEPGPVDAHATGATQITVFWPEYVGATGYYVYRATTPDGFDFDNPLNATPVNIPTYQGSFFRWYTDTGLTTGQTYYYAVRAVRSGNPPILSAAGKPDDAFPTADAIPWHTRNPAQILDKVRAGVLDPIGTDLVCSAPDGTAYDARDEIPPSPPGVRSPDANVIDMPEGGIWPDLSTYITVPEAEDASEESDPDNAKSGPCRRVLSATGYRKAQMKVRLPTYLGVDSYPKTYQDEYGFPLVRHKYGEDGKPVATTWASSDDVPYVYLGITPTVPGLSDVEGGLRFHRGRGAETEWKVYMVGRPRVEIDPETGKPKLGSPRSWQTAPKIDST